MQRALNALGGGMAEEETPQEFGPMQWLKSTSSVLKYEDIDARIAANTPELPAWSGQGL